MYFHTIFFGMKNVTHESVNYCRRECNCQALSGAFLLKVTMTAFKNRKVYTPLNSELESLCYYYNIG